MTSVFLQLDKKIQEYLVFKKINYPTESQTKSIPFIMNGENVLLIAPTGLGKTESALLPIFHNFLLQKKNQDEHIQGISILYITPLRALNRDMLKRTIDLGKNLGIDISVRHGDTSQSERVRQSKEPPDMLITTPETLQILFTGKRLRKNLQKVKWVVIDEIHELADNERGAQLSVGLERLFEITNENNHSFQRIGLSATVGSPEEVAKFLTGYEKSKQRSVKIIEVDVTKLINLKVEIPKIKETDYNLAKKLSMEPFSFSSLRRCKELIDNHVSTLFFINTRDGAEILTSRFNMWLKDYPIGIHHGSLSKLARIEAEDDFKMGNLKSLICTSSLELGIDVGDTDFVIQYSSPREVKRILQRVGRSGHNIDKTSKGVIIATSSEDLSESVVISRKALASEIEKTQIRKNPLSVLCNQIISIALEYGKIKSNKIYKIVTRAYPFNELKYHLFKKIVEQLKNQKNIWIDEQDFIVKKANSRHYFIDNISMIPDEISYQVIDISTRKLIGKLDESFVLNNVFEGEKFILRGRTWNVIKIEENYEILVSQSNDLGNVPSWSGEDIPVPFEVAVEVGKLRRKILEKQEIKDYPCDIDSIKKLVQHINKQVKQGFKVPDDKNITIDIEDKTVVINACFGTKVNETLGRLISAILIQSIGESIGLNSDPYRINLELPGRIPIDKIKEIFYKIKPESLEYLLRAISKNSNYIQWQLVHVGRKFGAIRKDFDLRNIGSKKLFTLFKNSYIFDEAIERIIWDRMDIKNTQRVMKEIQNGNIKIIVQKLSPISIAGLETIKSFMAPRRADRSILIALKERLEETAISLVCTNCGKTWNTNVGRVKGKLKCSNCEAIKIAVLRRYNRNIGKILIKKDLNIEEKKELKRLHKNASLVLTYGQNAIITLVGRGIGPDTAARILMKYNTVDIKKSEEVEIKFLRDILKAELNYAKTRGFWDD